jgi:hypothetical protein
MALQPFEYPAYTLVTRVLSLRLQMVTRVFGGDGALCAVVEHSALLQTELFVYADETMLWPLFLIRTRRFASLVRKHDLFDLGGARRVVYERPAFSAAVSSSAGSLDPENRVTGEMGEESPVRRGFMRSQRARHRIDLGSRTVATMTPLFRLVTPVSQRQLLPVAERRPGQTGRAPRSGRELCRTSERDASNARER